MAQGYIPYEEEIIIFSEMEEKIDPGAYQKAQIKQAPGGQKKRQPQVGNSLDMKKEVHRHEEAKLKHQLAMKKEDHRHEEAKLAHVRNMYQDRYVHLEKTGQTLPVNRGMLQSSGLESGVRQLQLKDSGKASEGKRRMVQGNMKLQKK